MVLFNVQRPSLELVDHIFLWVCGEKVIAG